jgi:hypothetical protein
MPLHIASANAYLRPPGSLLVGAPGTGNWTILAWVKPPAIFNTYTRTLWYLNNSHCLRMTASQQLQFVYGAGSDNLSALSPDTWYCTAVTKQATTAAKYYLNGAYLSQRTTGLSNDDTAAATIGAWNGAQDWLFANFSTFKIWDAVLTDAEIAQESRVIRPLRTANLRAWYPFRGMQAAEYLQDHSGNARHLTKVGAVGQSTWHRDIPIGYGAPVGWVGSYLTPGVTLSVTAPAVLGGVAGAVTIEGGHELDRPLIEVAVDTDATGRYTTLIPASRIRAVRSRFGFKGLHTHLSDNADCELELRNEDGAYSTGGGLFMGQWAKVRLAASGELVFTGRITGLTTGYGVSNPYVQLTLSTLRNDLSIPAQSVLLKDTNTREAALALMAGVPLAAPAGELIWDFGDWDEAAWAEDGSTFVRTYGSVWTGLAAAGGYGKTDGDLNVLTALADLMAAEDGRAVWGRDNKLELYSRECLDDLRAGETTCTLTDDEIAQMPMSLGAGYVNEVVVKWVPTRWQAGAAVYTYEPDSAASIQPGEFRDFNVRFRVDGSDKVVAAESLSVTVTSSGGSVSSAWAKAPSATGGSLRVSNGGPAAASITKIVITGTALVANDAVEERRQSVIDQTLYGLRSRTVKATLIDRATEATARADREFLTGNERAAYAEQVKLTPAARADVVRWLTVPFATPVLVQSARMQHTARYLVIGTDWRIGEGGTPVDVSLFLEPVTAGGFLTWDDDEHDRGLWDSGRWAF